MMAHKKILVTGGTGLLGGALALGLTQKEGVGVRVAVRNDMACVGMEAMRIGNIGANTDWTAALVGISDVLHAAARVHIMRDSAADPLAEFRAVNVDGTLSLARQAALAGVRRLVFISSVKVNGEMGLFRETDDPAPQDAYGISKMEAEQGLRLIAKETGMEVVIIRPPLVYGPGVRANFRTLMQAVAQGWPLPLGAIRNRRSLVALDNLVDFVLVCLEHPGAANETFLVSDGEDVSTPELIRRMASAMGRRARLVPVPMALLRACAALLGRGAAVQRLCGSLQVDISKAREVLGWTPPLTLDEGLKRTVRECMSEAVV